MAALARYWGNVIAALSGPVPEGLALLMCRLALGGVFWRSGRAKIEEGTLFSISESTRFLFAEEYKGVPLPPEIGAVMATSAEHILPLLLLLGLGTRIGALGLLVMTMVIQLFVYPDAWWPVHSLWVALGLVLLVRGAGLFSLDRLIDRRLLR